jgi:integrase
LARHRFTDRWIQAAAAGAADRLDFADSQCPCLHLRVSRRGTKTFSAMVRVNGRLQRRTMGRYPRMSLAEAREATRLMLRAAAEGIDPRKPKEGREPSLTYFDLVEQYTERHLKPNARSWKQIRSALLQPAMRPLRTRPANGIAKGEIVEIIDGIMAAGKAQSAINLHRYLKMLFNWAADRDLVPANPCDRIRPPAKTVERDRILTDSEIAAVWAASLQLPPPYRQMYQMFFLTGQRRSEVATMRWTEISGDVWTIPREKVKKDRAHAVPLTATTLAILATLPRFEDDGYVFSTTGGKSASSNFAKIKQTLDAVSGVSGWRIHDIRRTVRSKLSELGVPREVARKVLNHEDGKVDRIYNRHDYLAEKREALERWEKMICSLVEKAQQTPGL